MRHVMKRWIPGALLLACMAAQPAAASGDAVTPVMRDKVRDFLIEFIDPGKTPQEYAACFSEVSEYYHHGAVRRGHIARDVAYFLRRWPQRDYRLVSIDAIVPDPEDDRALVRYAVRYAVSRQGQAASGTAYYIAQIGNLDDRPEVERIEEIIPGKNAPRAP